MSEVEQLDLRGIPCPQNAAKAMLYISGMMSGEKIFIVLDQGEPAENVPESLKAEGHQIDEIIFMDENSILIKVTVV